VVSINNPLTNTILYPGDTAIINNASLDSERQLVFKINLIYLVIETLYVITTIH